MSDYIKINRTDSAATQANLILTAVSQIRALKNTLDAAIGIGYHNFDAGSPPDFTQFETLFGVPTGKGNAVFDLLNGTRLALTGAAQNDNAITLMEQVG